MSAHAEDSLAQESIGHIQSAGCFGQSDAHPHACTASFCVSSFYRPTARPRHGLLTLYARAGGPAVTVVACRRDLLQNVFSYYRVYTHKYTRKHTPEVCCNSLGNTRVKASGTGMDAAPMASCRYRCVAPSCASPEPSSACRAGAAS